MASGWFRILIVFAIITLYYIALYYITLYYIVFYFSLLQILIGFDRGLIVLWDLKENKADVTFSVTQVAFCFNAILRPNNRAALNTTPYEKTNLYLKYFII